MVLFVVSANAQYLKTETYPTVYRDTITIVGSTNQGSDWFTDAGYKQIYVEIYNNGIWYSAEVELEGRTFSKYAVNWLATDSSLYVVGFTPSSQVTGHAVALPLKNINATTSGAPEYVYKWGLKYGDGTKIQAVSPFFIKFYGTYKGE